MKDEEAQEFKVGDLVVLSPDAYEHGIRVNVNNFPWRVKKIEGNLVTVLRRSHKTGKEYPMIFHKTFLKKVEESVEQ